MKTDVLIIGAGAAGLFCAIEAAKRGRQVLLIEQSNKPGRKILMSGGGRCNFTNLHISPDKYLSQNPHFSKSALARYTQWDFIDWVNAHEIAYHEKTQGQLFCDTKARVLLDALLLDCQKQDVNLQLKTNITSIKKEKNGFSCLSSLGKIHSESLVIATGGLSIPSMGSNPFAYKVAEQFDIPVIPTRAGLVPFTLDKKDKDQLEKLSGISFECCLSTDKMSFTDDLLLTHRGLSGPAALQLSSYWFGGDSIQINCFPKESLAKIIEETRQTHPTQHLGTCLSSILPNRLAHERTPGSLLSKRLSDLSSQDKALLTQTWEDWCLIPSGTEGYRTAEVTLGGIDTHSLSSKTMMANTVDQLYFIGECVDVTGWLGGYNFQWAWSSAWAAAQVC